MLQSDQISLAVFKKCKPSVKNEKIREVLSINVCDTMNNKITEKTTKNMVIKDCLEARAQLKKILRCVLLDVRCA